MRVSNSATSLAAATVVVLGSSSSQSQNILPTPTAILGRVIDGSTGQPIAGARVARPGHPEWTLTTRDGEFAFLDVVPGSYRLMAMKAGYISGEFGEGAPRAEDAGSAPWEMTDQAQLVTVPGVALKEPVIRLWKHATISGRIADEDGDSVVGVQVQAWPRMFPGGRARFVPALAALGQTDDRGLYRISSLLPGSYVIAVPFVSLTRGRSEPAANAAEKWSPELHRVQRLLNPPEATQNSFTGPWLTSWAGPSPVTTVRDAATIYPTTFHLSTTTLLDGVQVRVSSGQDVEGMDIQLRPVPARSVAGRVIGPSGPAPNITLTMTPVGLTDLGSGAESAMAISDARGEFSFAGIPEGQYRLAAYDVASTGRRNTYAPHNAPDGIVITEYGVDARSESPTLWADQLISVGGANADAVVNLRRGMRVSGTVAFVGTAAKPDTLSGRLSLVLDRADSQIRGVKPANEIAIDEEAFRSIEIPPGRYFLRAVNVPSGWWLQSARHELRDLSSEPFEVSNASIDGIVVTLTDRPSRLEGTVTSSPRTAPTDLSVVVFPADPKGWLDFGAKPRTITRQRVDPNGAFRIVNLPRGEYLAVAVDNSMFDDWPEAQWFRRMAPSARLVRIVDGESRTVGLTFGAR